MIDTTNAQTNVMPDVAMQHHSPIKAALAWAGMSKIPMFFQWVDSQLGVVPCHGRAHNFVDLQHPTAKGIHMSRLYLLLMQCTQAHALSPQVLCEHLKAMLKTHTKLSAKAALELEGEFCMMQKALKSENQGWKAYPFAIKARLSDASNPIVEVKLTVTYASTCPCSASLSRQRIEQAMQMDFKDQSHMSKTQISEWLLSERGSYATAHGQRCHARIKVQLDPSIHSNFPIKSLVETIENALQTPVQAAVKREDEQAFAELNGHHLMFCEDAARRVQAALMTQDGLIDYWTMVEHEESLHAHNAVAVAIKGVPGGYTADWQA